MRSSEYKTAVLFGGEKMIGRALETSLKSVGLDRVEVLTHNQIDSLTPSDMTATLKAIQPSIAFNLYSRGGGIGRNKQFPADLFMQNLIVDIHLLPASLKAEIPKYVNVLPNCIYPTEIPIPFQEMDLWKGYPEETISYYAMAKKTLLVQSNAFRKQFGMNVINLIVTAAFGPSDSFDSEDSQVIPSMILKFDKAIKNGHEPLQFWGSGHATREFIYVDDAAEGVAQAGVAYESPEPLNICTANETSIKDLASMISTIMGYRGQIEWNITKPEGIRRKCLSNHKLNSSLKFQPRISIVEGLQQTIRWYHEKDFSAH
jgi:GDP-L-fucose synthase